MASLIRKRIEEAGRWAEKSGTAAGRMIGEDILGILEDEESLSDLDLLAMVDGELDSVAEVVDTVRARISGTPRRGGER